MYMYIHVWMYMQSVRPTSFFCSSLRDGHSSESLTLCSSLTFTRFYSAHAHIHIHTHWECTKERLAFYTPFLLHVILPPFTNTSIHPDPHTSNPIHPDPHTSIPPYLQPHTPRPPYFNSPIPPTPYTQTPILQFLHTFNPIHPDPNTFIPPYLQPHTPRPQYFNSSIPSTPYTQIPILSFPHTFNPIHPDPNTFIPPYLQPLIKLHCSIVDDHVDEPQQYGHLLLSAVVLHCPPAQQLHTGPVRGQHPHKLQNLVHWNAVFCNGTDKTTRVQSAVNTHTCSHVHVCTCNLCSVKS